MEAGSSVPRLGVVGVLGTVPTRGLQPLEVSLSTLLRMGDSTQRKPA